jgi:hypothetical protein
MTIADCHAPLTVCSHCVFASMILSLLIISGCLESLDNKCNIIHLQIVLFYNLQPSLFYTN